MPNDPNWLVCVVGRVGSSCASGSLGSFGSLILSKSSGSSRSLGLFGSLGSCESSGMSGLSGPFGSLGLSGSSGLSGSLDLIFDSSLM